MLRHGAIEIVVLIRTFISLDRTFHQLKQRFADNVNVKQLLYLESMLNEFV